MANIETSGGDAMRIAEDRTNARFILFDKSLKQNLKTVPRWPRQKTQQQSIDTTDVSFF